MPNMLRIVSLVLCKRPDESNVALTDVWFYLSNEISGWIESKYTPDYKHLFHTFLLLFSGFGSKYGCRNKFEKYKIIPEI